MPTTEASPAAPMSREARFVRYIREAAGRAGYDIDSPRGGGKKAIAKATGMSQSSVGRMLAGQTIPSPPQLEKLADALEVPLIDLLVLSGVVSERAKSGVGASPPPRLAAIKSLTIEEAADALGIRSPDRVRMFKAMASTLIEQEQLDAESAGRGA
ncbi:helix-turn-helix domain-containing protein [Streptomyces phaeochromogenes]|uniref:helix-turn-helix domain-containing protein n=1 Tax=Streptomyces phaeochromogenes TaxID=1923 RepID=UPI0033FDF0F6